MEKNQQEKDETRKEKYDKIIKNNLLNSVKKKVNEGRITLYVLGGLNVIVGLVYMATDEEEGIYSGIIQFIVAAIFLTLAVRVDKKPYQSILIGLIVYCSLIGLSALLEPASLIQGVILKIIIISALVKGLNSAREVEKLRKELDEHEKIEDHLIGN